MKQHSLTSSRESTARWIVSIVLPIAVTIILLLTINVNKTELVVETPPVLQLEYVVITPEKKEKATPPKKKIVKKIKKPTPVKKKSVSKPKSVALVKESPKSEQPADITAGKETEKEEVVQANSTPQEIRITGESDLDNTSFSPLYNPKPAYPIMARKNRITGYVDISLSINEKGKVTFYEIIKSFGHPTFGVETAKVISRWRFPPPRKNGKKVKVQYIYRINFTLN